MNKFRFTINTLAIAIFTFAFASLAQAQATRTWVSGVGDDANPCSRTAPCKTWAGAISKTAAGGEIDALDPGGFGALTITKAITIDGGGGQVASTLAAGTNGFVIAAGANDIVTIANVRFNGVSQSNTAGLNAIRITSAKGVHIMNCVIYNWSQDGIVDVSSGASFLEVSNTSITNCANGIHVDPSAGAPQIDVAVYNTRTQGNSSNGMLFGSNVKASILSSVMTHNISAGVFAQQTAGGATDVNVDTCIVSNNVNGFQANTAGATIRVANSTAVSNTNLGVIAGGGVVSSYGNNRTAGLTFPSTGTGQQ